MQRRGLLVELAPHRDDPDRQVLRITRETRSGRPLTMTIYADELGEFADAVDTADCRVNPESETT